ncbi:hypothetical protein PPERSA_10179 [Pseudocohnilembus persalinus]|uniref:Uncharacterized protein n=1 Tax=Pseudocohnilembus persalinus TaxID=266149 RepID=A0A0V0QLP4_PSEPJ|nr:hypothetical protein PPERSA_10179 [Pseudocohnilembus persalinus]|eukprot:KRX03098.1 hypothetical protein PPERSA_10179 [Pseudocohnilembus persalinus]
MSQKSKKPQKNTKYWPKIYDNYTSSEDERKSIKNANKKRKQSHNISSIKSGNLSFFNQEHNQQLFDQGQTFNTKSQYFRGNNNSNNNNSGLSQFNQNNYNNYNYNSNSNYESDYSSSQQQVYQNVLNEDFNQDPEFFLKDMQIQCNGEIVYSNGEYSDLKCTIYNQSSSSFDSGQDSSQSVKVNKNFAGAVFQTVPSVMEIGAPSFL